MALPHLDRGKGSGEEEEGGREGTTGRGGGIRRVLGGLFSPWSLLMAGRKKGKGGREAGREGEGGMAGEGGEEEEEIQEGEEEKDDEKELKSVSSTGWMEAVGLVAEKRQ